MAYQGAVRLSNSLCIEAGQGDPVRGVGYQKPVKGSETAPAPTVRSPIIGPNYAIVTCLMQVPCLSAQSLLLDSVLSHGVLDPSGSYSPFSCSLLQESPSST